MKYFLTVLGMVLVCEGLPYFTFPERMKEVMKKIPEIPTRWLRLLGLVLITVGILIMYLTKYYFQ